ncbi:MAG: hypothetical protein HY710_00055 [Candidatus Latescibacteria bacterium]|nr:hypothetical protein [Candidatus Latescibacterota bacterium]
MTPLRLVVLTSSLLALTCVACAPASSDSPASLPYIFRQRFTFTESNFHGVLDIDQDGQMELSSYGKVPAGPYALMLHVILPSGTRVRWQLNLPMPFDFSGNVDLDGDHRDEICIGLIEGDHLLLKVYDQAVLERPQPLPRWTADIVQLKDTNRDGTLDSRIMIIGTTDVNGDRRPDLIGQIKTGFDLTPRGIVALDGRAGTVLWFYPMGTVPNSISIQDLTGDQRDEILIGTVTPGNGADANGTDDLHSYLIVLDNQGHLLWQQRLGGTSTVVKATAADVNGDRIPEIVTALDGPRTEPNVGQIGIWDGKTGRMLHRWNSPWSVLSILTTELNRDGRDEIIVGTAQGLVAALDESLKTVLEYNTGKPTGVQVYDFNRDGRPEIYCVVQEAGLLVLDDRFRPMATLKEGRQIYLVQLGPSESPFSFLVRQPSDVFSVYDLRPAPVLSRLDLSLLRYAGVFISGVAITAAMLLLYVRRTRRSSPSPQSDGMPFVLAWATVAQALAHELKSPLNVMSLTLRRLMQQTGPEHTPSFTVILDEMERLGQRANAVMRFVDCVHLKKQPLDVNPYLKERAAFYQQTVLLPAEIVLKTEEGLPMIYVDPDVLGMVLENLIENAVAAMDGQHGQIIIITRSSERLESNGVVARTIVIEVMDTGAGIPEAHLAKVFEPTFTTKPSGTGFGLPIARHLVEAHGGTLDLRSREGAGTVVTMTLNV